MANKRRIDKKKEEQGRFDQRKKERENSHVDGIHSMVGVYFNLLAHPPVKGLLGLFEIEKERFTKLTTDELFEEVGLRGQKQYLWSADYETSHQRDNNSHGMGFACGTLGADGRVMPVVFVRKEVDLIPTDSTELDLTVELEATVRVLVLVHELGHAEDIIRQVNFKHTERRADIVGAEAYAHKFVLDYCKRQHYRLAIQQYLINIDRWTAGEDCQEYERLGALRLADNCNLDEYRAIAGKTYSEIPWQREIVHERMIKNTVAENRMNPEQEKEFRRKLKLMHPD